MTFIFRNRTIFWDISKWNRGQKKWDGGSIFYTNLMCACGFRRKNKKQKTKNLLCNKKKKKNKQTKKQNKTKN